LIDQNLHLLGPLSGLQNTLNDALGEDENRVKTLLCDELKTYQQQHEPLLVMWHLTIEEMVLQGLVGGTVIPKMWFALIEFLKLDIYNNSTLSLNLLLEEVVLKDQESDDELAANDDLDKFQYSNPYVAFVENEHNGTNPDI
jgi:hypothetical protein